MAKNLIMKLGGVAIAAAIAIGYTFFNPSGYSQSEISNFVQGTLDSFYKGTANSDYLEMLNMVDAQVYNDYSQSVDVEVDNIMYIYGLDQIDGVQVMDIDTKLTDAVKSTLFPKTSFEVTDVAAVDGYYEVTVVVDPVLYGEAIDARLEPLLADPEIYNMTDKEFYDAVCDEMVLAMTDAVIGEPQTFIVIVSKDSTDTWGINEASMYPVYDSIVTYEY